MLIDWYCAVEVLQDGTKGHDKEMKDMKAKNSDTNLEGLIIPSLSEEKISEKMQYQSHLEKNVEEDNS